MSAVIDRPESYQDYSPQRKAEVLELVKSNGGNVLRTAEETGIRHTTIQYWMANSSRFDEFRHQEHKNLESKLDSTVHRLIDSIDSHDLSETPLNHKATAFGIVFDKLQLLRGQPTSIIETIDSTEVTVILEQAITDYLDTTGTVIEPGQLPE